MIAVETLRQMLTDDIEAVCRGVLASVRVKRHELRGEDGAGNLWVVALVGAKRGLAFNATVQRGGNMFDLVLQAAAGGDLRQACRIAEGLLGLGAHEPVELRRREAAAIERRRIASEEEERARAQRVEDIAQRAFDYGAGDAVGPGNPAGLYLALRRCLPLDPLSLRSARHTDREGNDRGACLLAPLTLPGGGGPVAWHETRLEADEGGRWRKRPGPHPAKMVWGPAAGAWIVLREGEGDTLLLAEGIENGLTASALYPELPAAAAYAVGNLAALDLPDTVRRVVLVRDCERNPRTHGPRARAAAIGRWWSEGRAVTLLDPPAGAADINEAAERGHPAPDEPPIAAPAWDECLPIEAVPAVEAWCRALRPDALPELARAHPDVATCPALVAQLVTPAGEVRGLAARLLSTAPKGRDLLSAVRSWGDRAGTVAVLRPRAGMLVRLGIGWEAAIGGRAGLAVVGLDHWAEAELSRAVWRLDALAPSIERDDDRSLWREGARRLHVGRELGEPASWKSLA